MSSPLDFDLKAVIEMLDDKESPLDPDIVAPEEFRHFEIDSRYLVPAYGPFVMAGVTGVGSTQFDWRQRESDRLPSLSGHDKLKVALLCALQIEFITIPMYLTALWSIIDQAHPVAKSVRAVVHEEMLHLALVCNLLSALGVKPLLTDMAVPQFPCRFPGNVHPEIELNLQGYGPRALKTFMEIERPEVPTPIVGEPAEVFFHDDMTIGTFYKSLLRKFKEVKPQLDNKRQIAGPFAWFVMTNLGHVKNALTLIMEQGEGADDGAPYSRDPRYLSHYYRFKSLAMLTELNWDKDKRVLRKGDPILSPAVFTLAPAPRNGYGLAAPREAREVSDKFDEKFSEMLRLLEGSWDEEGDESFIKALERMFDLGTLAQTLMHIGTPDGRGHCPTFRYRGAPQ